MVRRQGGRRRGLQLCKVHGGAWSVIVHDALLLMRFQASRSPLGTLRHGLAATKKRSGSDISVADSAQLALSVEMSVVKHTLPDGATRISSVRVSDRNRAELLHAKRAGFGKPTAASSEWGSASPPGRRAQLDEAVARRDSEMK